MVGLVASNYPIKVRKKPNISFYIFFFWKVLVIVQNVISWKRRTKMDTGWKSRVHKGVAKFFGEGFMGFRKKIEDTPFWGLYFILIISFWTILEERTTFLPLSPPPPVFVYELKDKQLLYQTKINIFILLARAMV